MHFNADFNLRAVVEPDEHQWVQSPQPGVERVMLDRVGGEVARATSLVRYAAGSSFPRHQHPGGEEILVLSGVFSDEFQDYPAGWYLRNPPGSAHQPASKPGAVIFVKLLQMRPTESLEVRIDTTDKKNWRWMGDLEVCRLHEDAVEFTRLVRLKSHGELLMDGSAREELLVLQGGLIDEARHLPTRSWLRMPPGQPHRVTAGSEGAVLYIKSLHSLEVLA